jgi:hypothetical protein
MKIKNKPFYALIILFLGVYISRLHFISNEVKNNCVLEFLRYIECENYNKAELIFNDDLRQNKTISRPELSGQIHFLHNRLKKNGINSNDLTIINEKLIFKNEFQFDVEYDFLCCPRIKYFKIIQKI